MVQELSHEAIESLPPIWESPNAELYLEAPGLRRYVIWEHSPGDEGVKRFDRFDNYDLLPHHYYKTDEEFEKAKNKYLYGGSPDRLIDITYLTIFEKSVKPLASAEILVFDAGNLRSEFDNQEIAA